MELLEFINGNIQTSIYNLLDKLQFDLGKIIFFNNDKSYALIKEILITNQKFNFIKNSVTKIIKISNQSHMTIINNAMNTKTISFLDYNSKLYANAYTPLIDDIKKEICISFSLDFNSASDIVGCVYLGSFDENNTVNPDSLDNENINFLINEIREDFIKLYVHNSSLDQFFNIIYIFLEVLKEKENYIINHVYNVAHWSKLIGQKLSYSSALIDELYIAALLHDMGKLYIPNSLLDNHNKLESDYSIYKNHSNYGSSIAKVLLNDLYTILDIPTIVKHHHEQYDGKGYPDGLKGEDIPLESRIIAVANAVEIMLSSRVLNGPKPLDEIIRELITNKKKQFDPNIVDIMAGLLINLRNSSSNILTEPILWCTLTLYTQKDTFNIEGILTNYTFGYMFKSDKFNFSNEIDLSELQSANLYIENRNNIYEFNAKNISLNNDTIYIEELHLKPSTDSFSIIWELEGVLNSIHKINILKIGGHSLTFYTDKMINLTNNTIKSASIKINFEDQTNVYVSGNIKDSYRIGCRYYYNFRYLNIPENVRDYILKQIFKKQIQHRKLLP